MSLSVDASSKGVSAVFLQNDRPVAYTSRALTPSQENYVQIEKEIVAIVLDVSGFMIIFIATRDYSRKWSQTNKLPARQQES